MARKAVSFGDLYAKSAKQRGGPPGATPGPAVTPGFRPLSAAETPLDAESTLPPSSSPETETPEPSSPGAPEAPEAPPTAPPTPDDGTPAPPASTADSDAAESFPDLDMASPTPEPAPAGPAPADVAPLPAADDAAPPPAAPEPPAAAPVASPGLASVPEDAPLPEPEPPAPGPLPVGDVTPATAEDRLKAMGVASPQIPGPNVLPDGRTVVVAQRQCISLHEISPACKAAMSSPGFLPAVEAARASVKSVLRDQSGAALDDLKQRLDALSGQQLSACDPAAAADLQSALTDIDSWSDAKTKLAAASAAMTRTQKAVEMAESAASEAREEYQRQQDAANQAEQSSGGTLSQQLPRLYKSLKKWEALASSAGG